MKNVKDIVPIIVLTIVVCVSVITLSLTDDITREIIEEQKLAEIKNSLKEQFPEMTRFEYDEEIEVYTIFTGDNTSVDNIIGYSFEAKGSGYGGTIEILVGLKDLETINAISIINHMETPGLGAKIVESYFTEQFKNVAIEDIKLRDNGGEIDAITGATISSNAVVKAIQKTTLEKVSLLKEKASL